MWHFKFKFIKVLKLCCLVCLGWEPGVHLRWLGHTFQHRCVEQIVAFVCLAFNQIWPDSLPSRHHVICHLCQNLVCPLTALFSLWVFINTPVASKSKQTGTWGVIFKERREESSQTKKARDCQYMRLSAVSEAFLCWQHSTFWNALWHCCWDLRVKGAKGEASQKNTEFEWKTDNGKESDRNGAIDGVRERPAQSNRESYFLLSFLALCLCCLRSAPTVLPYFLLTLCLACHYPQQSVKNLITSQWCIFLSFNP